MKDILVVVDMQNDFIDGTLGSLEAKGIVANVVRKIKDFKGDIFYTRDTHKENYLETMEGKKLPVIHCIEYTEGWKIRREVMDASQGKNVVVIDKPTFASIDLSERIYEKAVSSTMESGETEGGIGSITLIGLCTDICVISNAINLKARMWETPIIVDSSCCAGVTPESHKNALEAMKMCQIEVI